MLVQNDFELNISLAEKFGVAAEKYADVPVTSLPFSVRVINRFMGNGITTVQFLLESTPQELMRLKGFGRNCLEEVENFCAKIGNGDVITKSTPQKIGRKANMFRPYVSKIMCGDFSFADEIELAEDDLALLEKYREGYSILGEELVADCVTRPEAILPILDMFVDFKNRMKRYVEVRKLAESLPRHRKYNKAYPYINAYTLNEIERCALQKLCRSENTTLIELANIADIEIDENYTVLARFLKWCSFDLRGEIKDLFEKLYPNERSKKVIEDRAKRHTLEQVGSELGITRERVRQIEGKIKRSFARYHSRIRIISKISAERNGDQVLTPSEIEEYCGQEAQELLFLLQSYEGVNYTYDRQLDVFVLGNDSIHERVNQYIEVLPDIVKMDQLADILCAASEEEELPAEMVEKAFKDAYRITGNLYHRYRLSLATIYERILEKYYPDGIKIYDADELRCFRATIVEEYGDVGLPQNDRALAARIASVCILCGRGIYKRRQKNYIPKDLESRIHKYIVDGDSPIFMTNTLFSVFEEELTAAGVTNKYYLQGILHALFADEFTFRRDYISKDASVTSVYSAIVEFIKRSQYPISKSLVQKEFPGITEIVISFATSDTNILNYFGEYLHASHLKLTEQDKHYLHELLSKLLSDGQAHHSKDVFDIINREKPEILKRNAALYQYSSFSILEYLFRDEFQFARPYIASSGVDIGRPAERLHDLIYSVDVFDISGISDFAKENRYQIQSILELVNSCNDEFLLINETTMMRIGMIGATKEVASVVDEMISMEIDGTMPIYELTQWNRLPKLNVPWTEWLIYSLLYKWGEKVEVSTSSNQFRMAVPLIAPAGIMDTSLFGGIAPDKQVKTIKIDDLDDIDALLEDIIDDDIWEEDI